MRFSLRVTISMGLLSVCDLHLHLGGYSMDKKYFLVPDAFENLASIMSDLFTLDLIVWVDFID